MEGAICPAEQIGNYNEIKDKCIEHQMVPLTVQTESQRDAYTDSVCANFVKDSTLKGHYWGFYKDDLRQWTDVHENAAYKEDLEKILEFNDPFNSKCVTSWFQYINNPIIRGGDYTCSNNNIGYVCIKPWADALANPDPFEIQDQKISFNDFTAVEASCREKGLYPMSLTNNIDISKFLNMYQTKHNNKISDDYNTFWLLKQENGIWKDWVGRTSDVEHGVNRHDINHNINVDGGCLVAWVHNTYDTDDQGCVNKYFACAKNTKPYSRRSEYNAQVLEWLGNPGNRCNLNIAACSNSEGSYTCDCKTGTFFTFQMYHLVSFCRCL